MKLRQRTRSTDSRVKRVDVLLAALLVVGCASDPRYDVLREEVARLETEVGAQRMTLAAARERLEEKTVMLFGRGMRFCEIYYARYYASDSGLPGDRRLFPDCYIPHRGGALPRGRH